MNLQFDGKIYFGLIDHLRKNDMISCSDVIELNRLVTRTAHSKELLKIELKKKLKKMIPEYEKKRNLGKIHFNCTDTTPPSLLCKGWLQTKTRITNDSKQVTCKNV